MREPVAPAYLSRAEIIKESSMFQDLASLLKLDRNGSLKRKHLWDFLQDK